MQHARPGGVSEQEAEEEQEKEERKKAQGTRRKNKFKMHEDEVKTVLMRVSGSRECTSVQLHHRCPVPISLLILKMFSNWSFLTFLCSIIKISNRIEALCWV